MTGIADILRALAWPLVTLVIALQYKNKLLSLIPELAKRGFKFIFPGGVQLEMSATQQQNELAAEIVAAGGSLELKELPGVTRTAAMVSLERRLHDDLKAVEADKKADVLVHNLAVAQLRASFGIIYSVIFGRQIRGLLQLEARRKVSNDEAFQYYLQEAKQYPALVDYGFAQWLGFLLRQGLIIQEEESVKISDFGADFLIWLRVTKLSFERPN